MVFDGGTFAAAIQLLRDQKSRGFRVDIETQSTIAGDAQQERADITQLVQATGAFMQSSLPMIQQMPQALPVVGALLQSMVRRFALGVEIEGKIDDLLDKLESSPSPIQNPQAGDAASKQQDMQIKAQQHAQDMRFEEAKLQADMQRTAAEAQGDKLEYAADMAKTEADMRMKEREEQIAIAEHRRAILEQHVSGVGSPAAGPAQAPRLEFGQGALTRSNK